MKKILSFISAILISTSVMCTGALSVNAAFDSTGSLIEEIKNNSDYDDVSAYGNKYYYIFLRDLKDGMNFNRYVITNNYLYVVITVDESYEQDMLKEEYGQDYSALYNDDANRHYFKYSNIPDYEKLYELPFVQKIELYNEITYTTFYRNIDPEFMESKNDPWFDDNEYDMDRSFQNTIIQRFTTTSETEITDEMFSDFDAEYVHVFKYKTDEEEAISYWEAYYKVNDDYSLFRKFDEYVQNIDGVLSSGGLIGYTEEQSASSIVDLVEVPRPDEITGSQITYGDIDSNATVDLSDLTMISQYILKDIELSADQIKCADVNADDEVNLQDLALMKQYVMNDNVKLGVAIK